MTQPDAAMAMSSIVPLRQLDEAPANRPDFGRNEPCEEAGLLTRLRVKPELDPEIRIRLQEELGVQSDPIRLWFLLACVELLPVKAIGVDAVYCALCRLAQAPQPLLRLAAYRWLAHLTYIDLRYENRARLILRDALSTETGKMHARVRDLLQRC